MKSTRKQLIESICHVLNSGCHINLCENGGNKLKLKPIMCNKKFMAEFYYDEVWNKYCYNLSIEGVTKCLKYLTLDHISGNSPVPFCTVGSEEVVNFRRGFKKRQLLIDSRK
jgi:hypothetical protein